MSSIASATVVKRSELGLPAGAKGRRVGEYPWSGYVLATLLSYLQERRKIDLMRSEFDMLSARLTEERRSTHFILTDQHSHWIADLAPENFSTDELRDYFNDFNESNESGVGQAMLDGIRFIRGALTQIDAQNLVVLSIG
jgi:hypothetical protein